MIITVIKTTFKLILAKLQNLVELSQWRSSITALILCVLALAISGNSQLLNLSISYKLFFILFIFYHTTIGLLNVLNDYVGGKKSFGLLFIAQTSLLLIIKYFNILYPLPFQQFMYYLFCTYLSKFTQNNHQTPYFFTLMIFFLIFS